MDKIYSDKDQLFYYYSNFFFFFFVAYSHLTKGKTSLGRAEPSSELSTTNKNSAHWLIKPDFKAQPRPKADRTGVDELRDGCSANEHRYSFL